MRFFFPCTFVYRKILLNCLVKHTLGLCGLLEPSIMSNYLRQHDAYSTNCETGLTSRVDHASSLLKDFMLAKFHLPTKNIEQKSPMFFDSWVLLLFFFQSGTYYCLLQDNFDETHRAQSFVYCWSHPVVPCHIHSHPLLSPHLFHWHLSSLLSPTSVYWVTRYCAPVSVVQWAHRMPMALQCAMCRTVPHRGCSGSDHDGGGSYKGGSYCGVGSYTEMFGCVRETGVVGMDEPSSGMDTVHHSGGRVQLQTECTWHNYVTKENFSKFNNINSYSASRDNWCTVGGDGGCRVGEVWAGTTSPMPEHKGFKLQ